MHNPPLDLFLKIKHAIAGEVRYDTTTRLLYSTDASIYQIEPLGVVFPKTTDDITACVSLAAEYQVPLIVRGAGSGLGGQAIGAGIILDTARYLNHILEIDPQERTITVEPGVVLYNLNRAAAAHDLTFAPDPASPIGLLWVVYCQQCRWGAFDHLWYGNRSYYFSRGGVGGWRNSSSFIRCPWLRLSNV